MKTPVKQIQKAIARRQQKRKAKKQAIQKQNLISKSRYGNGYMQGKKYVG